NGRAADMLDIEHKFADRIQDILTFVFKQTMPLFIVRPQFYRPSRQAERVLQFANLIQMFFSSVKNLSASKPPSRPTPLSFIPPNGVRKSRRSQQFSQTTPHSRLAATRCARERFSVHTVAERP